MTSRSARQLRRLAWPLLAGGVAGFLPLSPARAADDAYVSPSQARIRADVTFLADDAREGRGVGTNGINAAADYIASAYKEAGLKPAPGAEGYFQPFTLRGDAKIQGEPVLAFKGGDGKVVEPTRAEFSPLAIGSGGRLIGTPLVFVGYEITAKDEAKGLDYDDYAGLDVKGKAVIILRREPQLDDEKSLFAGTQTTAYATFNHKASNAFKRGAAAVLFVNDKAGLKGKDDLILPLNGAGSDQNSPIPFVMVSRTSVDTLMQAAGLLKLEELEAQIDRDFKPQSRAIENYTLTADITIDRSGLTAKNVIGVLEGAGPFKEETIVVGGHYDHLGSGGLTSGSLAPFNRNIHNGADDNASGTATVMELARRLGKRADPLPRRIVFMAFSGEERGLLGSRHYVEHPLIPLDQTVMMLNFDMVGRLNDKDELTVMGLGSTPNLEAIVDALGTADGFKVKKVKGVSDGFGGSDHESFYGKGIPVFFAFTGLHNDYHRPSDDTERINFPGMLRVADFGELVLLDVARRPSRPAFVGASQPRNPHANMPAGAADPARSGNGAYMGTVPDYGSDEVGVKLSDVRADSPSAKGGLKGGDTIIKFAGQPISSIYDYTDSLNRAKPGDEVEVVVKRDGKEVPLRVKLGTRGGQ